MSDEAYPIEDFQTLIRPLLGLAVSLPWKGYGSTIFLELGGLAPLSPRQRHNAGEACISAGWDWRVEAGATVLYGSSCSGPSIQSGLASLQGHTIQDLAVVGQIPELVARISNGHCLRSMSMAAGDPQWSVKLPDGRWICPQAGSLRVGEDGASVATEQEEAAFALAERTASRWGKPVALPKRGLCANCLAYVPLDGEGHLLDYGVCIAEGGPFDGRAVSRNGGCPAFIDDGESGADR